MSTGLVLREERNHTRPPSWKAWVHVTCKRRAIVTLYLLYWSFAVYSGIPSRSCGILGPLPASAPKFLWQATSAEEWEVLYNRWLVKWDDGCFLQGELDNISPGIVMNRRAEMWLEEADEFGLLIMSIGEFGDIYLYNFSRYSGFSFPWYWYMGTLTFTLNLVNATTRRPEMLRIE